MKIEDANKNLERMVDGMDAKISIMLVISILFPLICIATVVAW